MCFASGESRQLSNCGSEPNASTGGFADAVPKHRETTAAASAAARDALTNRFMRDCPLPQVEVSNLSRKGYRRIFPAAKSAFQELENRGFVNLIADSGHVVAVGDGYGVAVFEGGGKGIRRAGQIVFLSTHDEHRHMRGVQLFGCE